MNNLLITISEVIEIIEQNFQCERGDTFELNLTFKDEDGETIDISKWTILFTAKLSKDLADGATGVVKKTAEIPEDSEGTANIILSKDDTDDLLGVYYYNIRYIDEDGNAVTVVKGKIVFSKEVSKRIE